MKNTAQITAKLLVSAALLVATTAAQAYFVRPVIDYGGSQIDGYVANGPTQSTQLFGSSRYAEVDLSEGTVRAYLRMEDPAFGQAAGVMGDTLTFRGGGGTSVDFSFTYDGSIDRPSKDPNLDEPVHVRVFANLWAYEASAGVTYLNFVNNPNATPLVSQTRNLEFSMAPNDSGYDLYELLNETLSGSFLIPDNNPFSVDIFASLSISAMRGVNPMTIEMDFLNTGRFGVVTAPGVTFSSESNVFPGSVQAPPSGTVPEPSSLALFGLAFAGMFAAVRRRKQRSSTATAAR